MEVADSVAEHQPLYGEREQCHYLFQKGINAGKNCDRMIPKGNNFCKRHLKTRPSLNLEVEAVSSSSPDHQVNKKKFDILPISANKGLSKATSNQGKFL